MPHQGALDTPFTYSMDGDELIAVANTTTELVRKWPLADGLEGLPINVPGPGVESAVFDGAQFYRYRTRISSDGKVMARWVKNLKGREQYLEAWSIQGEPNQLFRCVAGDRTHLFKISGTGRYLAWTEHGDSKGSPVFLVDLDNTKNSSEDCSEHRWAMPRLNIAALSLSTTGKQLVLAGGYPREGGALFLYNTAAPEKPTVETLRLPQSYQPLPWDLVDYVVISPSGKYLAASLPPYIRVFGINENTDTYVRYLPRQGKPDRLIFDPSEEYLVASFRTESAGEPYFWNWKWRPEAKFAEAERSLQAYRAAIEAAGK